MPGSRGKSVLDSSLSPMGKVCHCSGLSGLGGGHMDCLSYSL